MKPFSSKPPAGPGAPRRRRRAWLLLSTAVLLVGAAAGWATWQLWPQQRAYYTDADTIRAARETAALRSVLWQPPVPLGVVLNTTEEDYEPRLSWDGLTLYFVRGRAGANADIYQARRTPEGWSAPEPLTALNSLADDLGPAPTADGRGLYFYSNREGGLGGYDLWVARRGDDGWDAPIHLDAVNSEFNDYGPAPTPGGETLYFASNRPRGTESGPHPDAWPATVREDLYRRTYDLYAAPLTASGPGPAEPVDRLNTPANEGAPCVSPAGDFLYFSSDRPGGAGGFDLFRARRLRGVLAAVENLGAPVNTTANELDPGLTALGYGLFFSSDRVTGPAVAGRAPDYNLYYCASREVFTEVETLARPPIQWAALWDAFGRSLFWAVLALLLLLLLLAALRDARHRKLSLLTRCLLVSLLTHAVLLFLFNFWRVTAGAFDYVRRGGDLRVALVAGGPREILAAQLRSASFDFALPAPRTSSPAEPPRPPVERIEPATFRFDAPAAELPRHTTLVPDPVAAETRESPPDIPGLTSTLPRINPAVPVDRPTAAVAEVAPLPPAAPAGPALHPATPARIASPAVAFTTPSTPNLAPARIDATSLAPSEAEAALPAADSAGLPEHVTRLPDVQLPRLAVRVPDAPVAAAAPDIETSGMVVGPQVIEPTRAPLPDLAGGALAPGRSAAPNLEPRISPANAPVASSSILPLATRVAEPATPAVAPDLGAPVPALPRLAISTPAVEPEPPAPVADAGRPEPGHVSGIVRDASTGAPLAEATVRLDRGGDDDLVVQTDLEGRYELEVAEPPDFFALSASRPGYLPGSANVPGRELLQHPVQVDFALEPRPRDIVIAEELPDVHHLGNDRFEGRINSQFQKPSEGLTYIAEFELTAAQADVAAIRLTLLAKGVQCRHDVRLNGRSIATLDRSPANGSFGPFTALLEPQPLRSGLNRLEIHSASCSGDIDDFEIVNVQLRLLREAQN